MKIAQTSSTWALFHQCQDHFSTFTTTHIYIYQMFLLLLDLLDVYHQAFLFSVKKEKLNHIFS